MATSFPKLLFVPSSSASHVPWRLFLLVFPSWKLFYCYLFLKTPFVLTRFSSSPVFLLTTFSMPPFSFSHRLLSLDPVCLGHLFLLAPLSLNISWSWILSLTCLCLNILSSWDPFLSFTPTRCLGSLAGLKYPLPKSATLFLNPSVDQKTLEAIANIHLDIKEINAVYLANQDFSHATWTTYNIFATSPFVLENQGT